VLFERILVEFVELITHKACVPLLVSNGDNLHSNARSAHRRLPVNFEAFEWRERHQSSVVEPHVNTPELLHGRIRQSFHLLAIGDICGNSHRPAAITVNSSGNVLRFSPSRTQHNACAFGSEKPGGRFAQSAACARNHKQFTPVKLMNGLPRLIPSFFQQRFSP
jgi:hypothetical protein